MTSWPKRIGNVATVAKSLLDQELQPDIIQINLSKEEFARKEEDLPEDLRDLLYNDSRVQIEWVDGNDGVFKKLIPTLKKHYGEFYYLLSVDDDWIYRRDYIKIMVDYLKKYDADSFCLHSAQIIGNRTIYKSTCFYSDFWKMLTPEIIATRIDDSYIYHYLRSKNKKMASFNPCDGLEITKPFNPVFPNSHNAKQKPENARNIDEAISSYSKLDVERAHKIIDKVVFDNRKKCLIVNYNTQNFTDACIKSINKHTPGTKIYVFDNSDKTPFVNTFDNVEVLDNTNGQFVNFEDEFNKFDRENMKKSEGAWNSWASLKHTISIQKAIEIINEPLVLFDSDVLVKKDFSNLYDEKFMLVGDIQGRQPKIKNDYWKERIVPFILYLNVSKLREYGISFYDQKHIVGTYYNADTERYDTGAWIYEAVSKEQIKKINFKEYVLHFGSGSWNYFRCCANSKKNIEQWLAAHNFYWDGPSGQFSNVHNKSFFRPSNGLLGISTKNTKPTVAKTEIKDLSKLHFQRIKRRVK